MPRYPTSRLASRWTLHPRVDGRTVRLTSYAERGVYMLTHIPRRLPYGIDGKIFVYRRTISQHSWVDLDGTPSSTAKYPVYLCEMLAFSSRDKLRPQYESPRALDEVPPEHWPKHRRARRYAKISRINRKWEKRNLRMLKHGGYVCNMLLSMGAYKRLQNLIAEEAAGQKLALRFPPVSGRYNPCFPTGAQFTRNSFVMPLL